jgi:hypothetical protein
VKQIYGRADSGFYCQAAVEAYEECNVSVAAENGAILAGKKGPVVRLRHGCRQRH